MTLWWEIIVIDDSGKAIDCSFVCLSDLKQQNSEAIVFQIHTFIENVDVNTSLQVELQAGEEPDLYFTTALRGQSSCCPHVSDDLVSNERFF